MIPDNMHDQVAIEKVVRWMAGNLHHVKPGEAHQFSFRLTRLKNGECIVSRRVIKRLEWIKRSFSFLSLWRGE